MCLLSIWHSSQKAMEFQEDKRWTHVYSLRWLYFQSRRCYWSQSAYLGSARISFWRERHPHSRNNMGSHRLYWLCNRICSCCINDRPIRWLYTPSQTWLWAYCCDSKCKSQALSRWQWSFRRALFYERLKSKHTTNHFFWCRCTSPECHRWEYNQAPNIIFSDFTRPCSELLARLYLYNVMAICTQSSTGLSKTTQC